MKKQIEKMIPSAVEAVKKHLAFDQAKLKVNEAYNGYISSYGAAIIQSGLLAATAMFSDENKKNKTKGDKTCLMMALLEVLKDQGTIRGDRLFDYVKNNQANEYILKKKILNASVALKLAIRTFELTKPQS